MMRYTLVHNIAVYHVILELQYKRGLNKILLLTLNKMIPQ